MSRITAVLLAILIVTITVWAQVNEEWVARYNGTGNSFDDAQSIAVDDSGNVYVTGYSVGIGTGEDYATIKYNTDGVQQWEARYNGSGNGGDNAQSIAVDDSGNVYVTGNSFNIETGVDYITIKYNTDGDQQWEARYNGSSTYGDYAYYLAVDDSGNVYVTGHSMSIGTQSDYTTIKYNTDGVQQWEARYNGPSNYDDNSRFLAIDDSGNVYVTGNSMGIGTAMDYATIKYNTDGDQQWEARYNGSSTYGDHAYYLAIDDSGNVYVTGNSFNIETGVDYVTIKYNTDGVQQWEARYNGLSNGDDLAWSLAIDDSGNVYVTGPSFNGANDDFATIKYDTDGIQQWVALYNGPGNGSEYAYTIAVNENGNSYVTGSSLGLDTSQDYATIKYNTDGIQQWVARYNGPGNGDDYAISIALDDIENVYVTGISTGLGTSHDYATIKYNTNGVQHWVIRFDMGVSDCANSIALDGNRNVYVTGSSYFGYQEYNITTVKYCQNDLNLILIPHNPPIQIPSGGGSFQFDLDITNQSQLNYLVDFWTDVTLIGGSTYPIIQRDNLNLNPQSQITRDGLTQFVPGGILPGTYYYNAHVRDHNTWEVLAEDSFPFEKLAGDDSPNHNFGWQLLGWDEEGGIENSIPTELTLYPAYPNPFNPSTVISFTLPEAEKVNLNIYDINGRLVTNLINGWRNQGTHQVTFEGSTLASGIYICQLIIDSRTATQKLLLVK